MRVKTLTSCTRYGFYGNQERQMARILMSGYDERVCPEMESKGQNPFVSRRDYRSDICYCVACSARGNTGSAALEREP